MEKTQPSDPPIEAIERGYEVGDVSVKGATYVVIGFIVLGIVTHAFLTLVWKVTYDRAAVEDPVRSAVTDERPPMGRPPLQPSSWHDSTPKQDMDMMRSNEARVLNSIGWTYDEKTPTVLPAIPDSILEKVATRPGMPTAGKAAASTRPAGGSR